jgi:hypothetical protein
MLAHTKSLKKQIKFMESTSFTPCYTIIELDHRIDEVDMMLRQAIMSIFASDDRSLFVAVDTSFYGDCVNFAYRNELEAEAVTMISALPLFLFASLSHLMTDLNLRRPIMDRLCLTSHRSQRQISSDSRSTATE